MSLQRLALLTIGTLAALAALAATCAGEGVTRYDVRVSFNTTVTQGDLDEVDAFLRAYDEDLDFLIQESFPPTGVARLRTHEPNFCAEVQAGLGTKSYVTSVSCQETSDATPSGSPDAPVTSP